MHSALLRQRGSSQRSSMQMARATNTRLPQDSRAELACGSTMPLVAAVSGDCTGLPTGCGCCGTDWPTGRAWVALVLVEGVP